MLQKLRVIIIGILVAVTVIAAGATFLKVGAESVDNPKGVSLRQEGPENHRTHGFFYMHSHSRSHLGGGLAGGK